ncbi:hypothetical protein CLV84_1869 [Neolewinella xylanilytica]|uniref:Uncharacterized protein n=1 Tax=Neolewinella xylanilytica TaxID=1514080 RepID=A0A2S6IBN0_9BACT|nr:hypothetical protein CLV84_1869 [Neolewinella xylanilytica]
MDFFALALICMLILATLALILYTIYRLIVGIGTPAH